MPITLSNLVTRHVPYLDEVFAASSVTSGLTGDPAMVQAGTNARRIKIPKITMDGLGDYSRAKGYVDGDVTVEWEEKEFNYDRGRKFIVDSMDDEETFHIAFGRLAGEFIRTKVAPEADAFTFAKLAGTPNISIITKGAPYLSSATTHSEVGKRLMELLYVGMTGMDNEEVPAEQRYLYITPANLNAVRLMETTQRREMLDNFAGVITVPPKRFYTQIKMYSGGTGETAGHYESAGDPMAFMIIHKPALIKFDKHVINSVITPEQNQTHDAYGIKYRKYGIVEAYDNKAKGICICAGKVTP